MNGQQLATLEEMFPKGFVIVYIDGRDHLRLTVVNDMTFDSDLEAAGLLIEEKFPALEDI